MDLLSKEGEFSVTDIYLQYFSTIQLASKYHNGGCEIQADNSLYDVLSKERYEMHKCKYYWNDLIKHKNFQMDKTTNILGNKGIIHQVFWQAVAKYGEDDIEIINRVAPFLFKIFNQLIREDKDKDKDKESKGVIIVTHSSIFP